MERMEGTGEGAGAGVEFDAAARRPSSSERLSASARKIHVSTHTKRDILKCVDRLMSDDEIVEAMCASRVSGGHGRVRRHVHEALTELHHTHAPLFHMRDIRRRVVEQIQECHAVLNELATLARARGVSDSILQQQLSHSLGFPTGLGGRPLPPTLGPGQALLERYFPLSPDSFSLSAASSSSVTPSTSGAPTPAGGVTPHGSEPSSPRGVTPAAPLPLPHSASLGDFPAGGDRIAPTIELAAAVVARQYALERVQQEQGDHGEEADGPEQPEDEQGGMNPPESHDMEEFLHHFTEMGHNRYPTSPVAGLETWPEVDAGAGVGAGAGAGVVPALDPLLGDAAVDFLYRTSQYGMGEEEDDGQNRWE